MARKVGSGPVTLATAPVPYISEWSCDVSQDVDDVQNATSAAQGRDPKNAGWEGDISFEYAKVGLDLGTLAVGGWEGVELHEYTFKCETDVKDSSGPNDLWKSCQAGRNYKWGLEVSKWQATDSHSVFLALLVAQAGTPAAIAIETPFGTGDAWGTKLGFSAGADILEEKFTLEGDGDLTSTDTYCARIIAQATGVLAAGYIAAQAIVLKEDAATIWGSGLAFVKSVEYKVGEGKVTGKIGYVGTGALTPSA